MSELSNLITELEKKLFTLEDRFRTEEDEETIEDFRVADHLLYCIKTYDKKHDERYREFIQHL